MKKRGDSGFSLVELIIVIAIMAILVGIGVPILIKNIEKAKVSRDYQMCDTIHRALEVAMADPDVMRDEQSQKMLYGDGGSPGIMNNYSGMGQQLNHYGHNSVWTKSELATTVEEIIGFNVFDMSVDHSEYIKSKKGTVPVFCVVPDENSDRFAVYIAWTDSTAGKHPENFNGSYEELEESKVIYVK